MLYFLETCEDTIRTLPVLQHDTMPTKVEDLDSEGEDHAADELRYACMSRPWIQEGDKPWAIKFPKLPSQMTFNDLLEMNRRARLSKAEYRPVSYTHLPPSSFNKNQFTPFTKLVYPVYAVWPPPR